jgi:hypothetical protein
LTAEIGWRLKGLNLPLFKGITILISWNNYLKKRHNRKTESPENRR